MAKIRVAALGDLHVHETSIDAYKMLFTEISEKADVLALCGDLTNLGLVQEAKNLAKDLAACSIPVLAVLGNHDHHSGHETEIKKILSEAKVIFLDEETFTLGDVGFAGIKGFGGGFGQYMLGAFGEKATKKFVTEAVDECLKLENHIKELATPHKVIILHYAPIMETLGTEPPEISAFMGCSRLEETVDRYGADVVFHGHSHFGSYSGKTAKGIPVYNVCVEVLKANKPSLNYALLEI